MNLHEVITSLTEERGLKPDVIEDIICEGVLSAYLKKYPDLELKALFNNKTGSVSIESKVTVVENPISDSEISLTKAKKQDSKLKIGDEVWIELESKVGRIEILKARQVIASKIREIEIKETYELFKDKEKTIVHGIVYKCEDAGTLVKVQDTIAFLPHSLSISGEKLTAGYPIRALLKEVLEDPSGKNQLVLDRASGDFLKELFSLEIPEIFDRAIEIKQIVRSPGYKSKVVVSSGDPNIDPVGTCVGIGGSRIRPILKELSGEKIDIISATESMTELVKNSLKPAKINKVEVGGDTATVWVDDDQRSLVVGRSGQNIQLASRLTGLDIRLAGKDKSVKDEVALSDVFLERPEKNED